MKTPTLKQVQKAEDKYNMLGMRIENAKRKAGYARSHSTGDLAAKKGRAFGEFYTLKREYEAAGNKYEPV